MTGSIPRTLQELHRIREQIAKEETGLIVEERVERTREEADALLKEWSLVLKRVSPSSPTSAHRSADA